MSFNTCSCEIVIQMKICSLALPAALQYSSGAWVTGNQRWSARQARATKLLTEVLLTSALWLERVFARNSGRNSCTAQAMDLHAFADLLVPSHRSLWKFVSDASKVLYA